MTITDDQKHRDQKEPDWNDSLWAKRLKEVIGFGENRIIMSWPRSVGQREWLRTCYGDTDSITETVDMPKWEETIKKGKRVYKFKACFENLSDLKDVALLLTRLLPRKIVKKKENHAAPYKSDHGDAYGKFGLYVLKKR